MRRRTASRRTPDSAKRAVDTPRDTSRREFLKASAVGLVGTALAPGALAARAVTAADDTRGAIVIKKQGSFFVGGTTVSAPVNDGIPPTDPAAFPPGQIRINQMYVQYQIPESQKFGFPIVLWHGGGHTGKIFETTPDGREGWATYFLRRGFAVYNIDGVNRGRSSYDITNINLVRLGLAPALDIPRINKYAQERAWTAFRIGPALGTPFSGSRFPVEAFEQYSNQLVPAYRDPIENDRNIAAAVALLDRIGPAIMLPWSQSGTFTWNAAIQRPQLVKAVVSVEAGQTVGSFPPGGLNVLAGANIPMLLVIGDHDPNRVANAKILANTYASLGGNATVLALPEAGIFGNAHVMMTETNNLEIADLIIDWLKKVGKEQK